MCHPTYTSGNGKEDCKHILGNANGLIDDACIEIHIGVEFSLDEVVIG
jgi:hypothetical protein